MYFIILLFLFFGCFAQLAGPQFPDQGSNPGPRQWKCSPTHWITREFPCSTFYKNFSITCHPSTILQQKPTNPVAFISTIYVRHNFWKYFLKCQCIHIKFLRHPWLRPIIKAHTDRVGGRFRMADTRTPMADSCQCMAKTTTIL